MKHEPYLEPEQLSRFDWWCRLVSIVVGLPLILFLLFGCGTVEPYWKVVDPNYRVPVVTQRLASAEVLTRICMTPRREDQGCAWRLPDACRVYLGPRANACIQSHEENGHCGKDGTGAKTHGNGPIFTQDCAYPEGK